MRGNRGAQRPVQRLVCTVTATLLGAALLGGCTLDDSPPGGGTAEGGTAQETSAAPTREPSERTPPSSPAPVNGPGTSAAPATRSAPRAEPSPDPRWRFFTEDRGWYTSAWFGGTHQVLIGFGCNASPWYAPDDRCPAGQGFHHGIDVALPCGTPLFSGVDARVLAPEAPGSPGRAYGTHPFRLRVDDARGSVDLLIAHAREVRVVPGQRVRVGDRLASASDSGAPDGCHLHLEVRPAGGSVDSAQDPSSWLELRPAR